MDRGKRLAIITWLGGLALIVQAMLPFLVAIEIKVATLQSPYITATGDALCRADRDNSPTGGDGDHGKHPHAICPLCAALATAQAFTTPSAIELPLPIAVATIGRARPLAGTAATTDLHPYEARGPPRAI